ncbi:MAG: hypothetical protein ACKO24_02210 [Leptolyngbyaceae cyanobacterium]
MSLKLTTTDLLVLKQHRLDRLRSLFPDLLSDCILLLEAESTLAIHCLEPWVVDVLLDKLNLLRWQVSLVLGVEYISVCFVGEEIFKVSTRHIRRRLRSTTGR